MIAAVWIILLVLFSVSLAPGLDTMFPNESARETIMTIYDNPIMVSMMGPIYGSTTGALYSSMLLLWYIIAIAVMNIFLAVRHTRADEEQWRAEVVRSLPVGRLAGVHAAMLTALIINTILAVLTGLGLAVTRIPSMDFAGCMLYGAVSGAVGLVFAAIALVFCQLSQSTSGAVGLSFFAMGGFYMLRAAGDIGGGEFPHEMLSLISPFGLALRAKIFVENDIIPLIALVITAAVIAVIAYKLNTMRDLGQGFIAAKPGRSEAKSSLSSPFGLSRRLLKKTVTVWLIVMLCAGASYGTVIGDLDKYVVDMPDYLMLVGVPAPIVEFIIAENEELDEGEESQDLTDSMIEYFAISQEELQDKTDEEIKALIFASISPIIIEQFGVFITSMMTLIALIPVLIAAMKLRNEEKEGRLEHILSRSVSRVKYLCGFVSIAFVLSVLMQLATAVGLYGIAATTENNPFVFGELIAAYLNYLPAMWVMLSIAVMLIGVFPKATGAIWGYYGFVCLIVFAGAMIPEEYARWITAVSPMKYIAQIPLEEFNIVPLAVMAGISLVLTVIGFIGYRNRDMM
jgi:ABC-2 type transport system permease protein